MKLTRTELKALNRSPQKKAALQKEELLKKYKQQQRKIKKDKQVF